ncbi:MMPL family transporter [Kitasatospora sp. MAP5-34]|uniref:MMPL family transporter n=1 Tax=Kitasatospora sp. MAP5-34 TaxID=3035102 RepID=UPI0024757769|nr:MMPL family transporter [Kitasatospora sp. MAP5-34]MDH6577361.1 RND superfamily putative drug exporter [Kitasatospora sp. MAP5-34]
MSQAVIGSRGAPAGAETRHRAGPLGRLAGWSFRRRGTTVLLWLVALGVAFGLASAFGGKYSADYSAPGSDSKTAQLLLVRDFPTESGETISAVVHAADPITTPAIRSQVEGLLGQLATVAHVRSVQSPYAVPGSISADGRTGMATLRLDVGNPSDMPKADTQHLLDIAARSGGGVQVHLGGVTVQQAEMGSIGSEGIGMAAAALILLLTFGSVVAAGLPLLTAVAGLAVSSILLPVLATIMPLPDWSTSLAAMMGIGVGIDYVLLLVTRYREWRAEGLEPEAATVATLDTAGRSVLVAGLTVVISMLGLFAMGLSFMRGAAFAAILSVLVVLVASGTLFPALLGYLGRHIDRLRLPLPRRGAQRPANEISPGWLRWSRLVERHRIVAAVIGVVVLLALAVPFLGVRYGFPDAGNDPAGRSNRQAYDSVTAGFGPGSNGPLLLVAELAAPADRAALPGLSAVLSALPDVAAVTPARLDAAGTAAVLTVVPKSGPQSTATEDLVRDLRDRVIPGAVAGHGLQVHVGGLTAASIDSTDNIVSRIPLLVGGVVAVSMLLLLVAFRSLAVALKAAAMNLLSVGAAYGVVALVLQGGAAGRLIGIDNPTPLPAFVPVLTFAVLFGLSMDYEVFLVSRMREAWLASRDNGSAIVGGLATTARVITAAAAIMVSVFAAFVPAPDIPIKLIGVGMASAILIDATLVRMLLVPAVMHLLGSRNWWLPAWLDRALPQLHIEGHPEHYRPATAD